MRVRWTPADADDLEEIYGYLERHFPSLAEQTISELYEKIRSLKLFPFQGRPGMRPGTRELVIPGLPYLAVYRVAGQTIHVLHIRHGARRPQ